MNVLVTGGSGRVGRYVVAALAAAGHQVTNLDLVAPPTRLPAPFLRVDLTIAGEIYQALGRARPQALIHLGAWPNAGLVPDSRTYGENVQGTFNILQASADLGVQRVILASTNQIYGFAGAPPLYAPVDEAHPPRPINSYALSKLAAEQAGDYFVRNYGLSVLAFRLMGVRTPEQLPAEIEQMQRNPETGAALLWTRTDARDAGQACRLAIEAADPPSGPYNITGPRVVLATPTAELIERYFGDQTELRALSHAHASPLSCAKAEAAFGYRPRFAWSEHNHFLE